MANRKAKTQAPGTLAEAWGGGLERRGDLIDDGLSSVVRALLHAALTGRCTGPLDGPHPDPNAEAAALLLRQAVDMRPSPDMAPLEFERLRRALLLMPEEWSAAAEPLRRKSGLPPPIRMIVGGHVFDGTRAVLIKAWHDPLDHRQSSHLFRSRGGHLWWMRTGVPVPVPVASRAAWVATLTPPLLPEDFHLPGLPEMLTVGVSASVISGIRALAARNRTTSPAMAARLIEADGFAEAGEGAGGCLLRVSVAPDTASCLSFRAGAGGRTREDVAASVLAAAAGALG